MFDHKMTTKFAVKMSQYGGERKKRQNRKKNTDKLEIFYR